MEASKALNIGVAAHITAAAVGGPRYDETLKTDERTAIENAIWLCQNCAKLVDNDVDRFPSEVLRAWKVVAEHRARFQIGRTAPHGRPAIADKFVDYSYPQKIGLSARLQSEGFHTEWVHSHREPILSETKGFERVEQIDVQGRRSYLKTREPDCEYMIFMKHRFP